MLVLTRRFNERIVLPGLGVTVTVLAVDGNTVRLGIQAPDEIEIHREEVWKRIRAFSRDEKENLSGGR